MEITKTEEIWYRKFNEAKEAKFIVNERVWYIHSDYAKPHEWVPAVILAVDAKHYSMNIDFRYKIDLGNRTENDIHPACLRKLEEYPIEKEKKDE